MLIRSDNPVITLSPQVKKFSKEFLESQNLGYFQITRCYASGGFLSLSTNPAVLIDWFKYYPVITPSAEQHRSLQTYSMLLDEYLPADNLDLLVCGHGLHNPFIKIYKHQDYFDVVTLSMTKECSTAGSYYLSSMKKIDDFYKDFLQKGRDLLIIAEKEKIMLPREKCSENSENLFLSNLNGYYEIQGDFGPTYVTEKELMCLKLQCTDMSCGEIADIFGETSQAIKNYIFQAKQRTGMNEDDIILIWAKYHISRDSGIRLIRSPLN